MMRVFPCEEPKTWGGRKRSKPTPRRPRRASSRAAMLPITPRPTMPTSYVLIRDPGSPCGSGGRTRGAGGSAAAPRMPQRSHPGPRSRRPGRTPPGGTVPRCHGYPIAMTTGLARYRVIDLHHMGQAETVASCLLESEAGPLLIDPGPAATLPALRSGLAAAGYAVGDLAAVLLTHIHLDHAGASGTLARENPRLTVYVHQAGAPHVVDPSKLLASATRLYGARMDELWGEVAPVPAERVSVLEGGERLAFGGRAIDVAYTPGHAWHHVSYYVPDAGVAFVGDTAGLRTPRFPWVLRPAV